MRYLKLAIFVVAISCGSNVFREYETKNAAEDAAKYLEDHKYDKAIAACLGALGSNYKAAYNAMPDQDVVTAQASLTAELAALVQESPGKKTTWYDLVSILASSHAQKYGIDALDLALALASSESTSGGNTFTLLFPVLPTADSATIRGVSEAQLILETIPTADVSSADHFKSALLLTAHSGLITKSLDSDGDGQISVLDAANVTAENAADLIDLLDLAAASVEVAGNSSDSESGKSADKIKAIKDSICEQEGDDDAAKVREYLSKGSGSALSLQTAPHYKLSSKCP